MMLVLVALVVTVVLVGATLTTRENAPAIGANAGGAAEATWSAESAVNFAVGAIVQAPDLEVLLGNDDTLTSAMTLGGATVEVKVTNLAGSPPTDADRELIVRAFANVGGVSKTLEKRVVRIPAGDLTDVADPYLSEFAIFATGRLVVGAGAKIGIWDLSPSASSSVALVKIGVGFADSVDLSIDAGAALARAGLYADSTASLALETAITGASGFNTRWMVPINIPTLPGGSATTFSSLPDSTSTSFDADASALTVPAGAHYDELRIRNGGQAVIDAANGTAYRFRRIRIENGGALLIRGSVQILVDEEFDIQSGTAMLEDASASAVLYLTEDLIVEDAKLGILPSDRSSGTGVISAYAAPARFHVIAVAPTLGGSSDPQWTLQSNSIFVGCLNNPLGFVGVASGSNICGNAVAREFNLGSGCCLLYCPTMDTMLGYTSINGPLYDSSGVPITEFADIINGAAALSTANGFMNKVQLDYNTLESDGTLDLLDLDGTVKTITQTINLGGLGIY